MRHREKSWRATKHALGVKGLANLIKGKCANVSDSHRVMVQLEMPISVLFNHQVETHLFVMGLDGFNPTR
jgi:hypothetical protein